MQMIHPGQLPDPLSGILAIDKPAGLTSFGVVARLRRVLGEQVSQAAPSPHLSPQSTTAPRITSPANVATPHAQAAPRRGKKRLKVGHTGTLDPFATGLMLVVVGAECSNAQRYSKLDKTYQATITLGMTSTTGDPEGQLTPSYHGPAPSQAQLQQVLGQFVGQVWQRPPAFSAIKINGKRAYQLARAGQAVEVPPRQVTIHHIELLRYQYPQVEIRARVGSGTYIRSLAQDIGQALGTGAYCSQLRRLSVGEWQIEQAHSLAEFGIMD